MDKYENLGIAGEGAYGVVLKCRNKDTGELVAIKKFREADADDPEARRFTDREVNILKLLRHENIVSMKEAFRLKKLLYVVFDFVEKSLMDLLEANPKGLGLETTRSFSCQLTRALEHCHGLQVLHRDVKPENLLIGDATLRLCDFGSACKRKGSEPLTDYVSTRWYRAPELLVRSDAYSAAVDMWALGCVTAEMATGRALFMGKTDLEQLYLIQKVLGPMTSEQMQLRQELSDPQAFPSPGEPQTLAKHLERLDSQLVSLLDSVVVMDPARRLPAHAALGSAWFRTSPRATEAKASRPPRPGSEQSSRSMVSSASAAPAPPPKPRVRRGISPLHTGAGRGTQAPAGIMPPVSCGLAPLAPQGQPDVRAPSPIMEERLSVGIASNGHSAVLDTTEGRSISISEGAHLDSLDNSVPEEISEEHIVTEEESQSEPQAYGSVDELLVFSGSSDRRGHGQNGLTSRTSSRPSSQMKQRRPVSSIHSPASLTPLVSG